MVLEKLLLKKEELPIMKSNCFQIPIHPKLLSPDTQLDREIANKSFPKAANEWYSELSDHVKILNDNVQKKWINEVFLKTEPKITKGYNKQILNGFWQDEVSLESNGFVRVLSISRNSGGTLYFDEERECETCLALTDNSGFYIKFSEDKIKEFAKEIVSWKDGKKGAILHHYQQHNIENYPGALFLRNWAILYQNEALKQVFK